MGLGLSDEKHYQDISAAIREKNGSAAAYQPKDMAAAILALPTVAEAYTGPTDVTPRVAAAVVLPTMAKVLSDDVTVERIPQFVVSNDAGGQTLIIGEEYYGR